MNIVETEMDVYEIANNIFTNDSFTSEHYTIHNSDLKTHFEMLIIILTEGLKLFYGNAGKVNLDLLSLDNFEKIKQYMRKIKIEMFLTIFDYNTWFKGKKNEIFIPYDQITITQNTKLEQLYFIFKSSKIYIINFKLNY